jgi:ParB-like chromosome segregation protein Spo0J
MRHLRANSIRWPTAPAFTYLKFGQMAKKRTDRSGKRATYIVRRKLALLRPHPRQAEIFTPPSEKALQELADDMAKHGLVNPVEITPDNVIIAGHSRVAAARRLGWSEIDCWLRDDLSPAEVDRRHVRDNLNRRQMSRLEFARACQRMRELDDDELRNGSSGDLRDVIGRRLGISGRSLDRLARVLGTPIEVQQAFDNRDLNLRQALAVAALPDDRQQRVAQAIARGTSPSEAVRVIGDVSCKHPMPKTILRHLVRELVRADELLRPGLHNFSTMAARHLPGLKIGKKLIDDLIQQISRNDLLGEAVAKVARARRPSQLSKKSRRGRTS